MEYTVCKSNVDLLDETTRLKFTRSLIERDQLTGEVYNIWWGPVAEKTVIVHLRDAPIGHAIVGQGSSDDWGVVCSVYVKTQLSRVTAVHVTLSAGRYVCHADHHVRHLESLTKDTLFGVLRDCLGYECKPLPYTSQSRPVNKSRGDPLVQTLPRGFNDGRYASTAPFPASEVGEQLKTRALTGLLWKTPCSSTGGCGTLSLSRVKSILRDANRERGVTPVALVCDADEEFAGYLFSYATSKSMWAAVVFNAYGFHVLKYDEAGRISDVDDIITSGWSIERILMDVDRYIQMRRKKMDYVLESAH